MSTWLNTLQKENTKLKNELKSLRSTLKNVERFEKSGGMQRDKENFKEKLKGCGSGLKKTRPLEKESGIIIKKSEFLRNTINFDRELLESFESYYESEEENIAKTGKCKISYIEHKLKKPELCKKTRKFLSECEFPDFPIEKNCGKPIKKKTGGSSHREKSRDFPLFKQHNCKNCDFFLAKGLPSTSCKKHQLAD